VPARVSMPGLFEVPDAFIILRQQGSGTIKNPCCHILSYIPSNEYLPRAFCQTERSQSFIKCLQFISLRAVKIALLCLIIKPCVKHPASLAAVGDHAPAAESAADLNFFFFAIFKSYNASVGNLREAFACVGIRFTAKR
jgi:hypothetical protein